MKASLFYLPTIASRAEIEKGMAGMNPGFYQRMLKELTEQIKLGDELGYDSVWTAEAYGSDALIPLAWWGSQTEQIKLVIAALACRGHVLFEDVPGTAKTVLARAIAGVEMRIGGSIT